MEIGHRFTQIKTEARGDKKTKDIDHRFFTDEH